MSVHAAVIPRFTEAQTKARDRAKRLAGREDYDVGPVYAVLEPIDDDGLWEVLFTGRYCGNTKAKIPGDAKDFKGPYRCWVREDGTGFVTCGW